MKLRTETDMVQFALERASRDPDKAEDVLRFFCDVVERGDVPERNVLEYLSGCFRRMIDDKKPLKPSDALNLSRTKGRRRGRTLEKMAERDLLLALRVVRCMKAGASRDDAYEQVAEERLGDREDDRDKAASSATVKRAYERYGQHVKSALTK